MKTNNTTLSAAALLTTLLASSAAFAGDVAVFPVKATNLTEAEGQAIGVLMSQAYGEVSKQVVDAPDKSGPALAATGTAQAASTQLGAKEYIEISAIKMSSKISIQASRFTSGGALVYQVKATATSLDDMEPVTNRLSTSLFEQKPMVETRTIDNVTGAETKKKNRMFNEKIMGIKTGIVMPVASGLDLGGMVALQFDGRLETDNFFLEFGAGMAIPAGDDRESGYGSLFAEIGGSYYLTHSSASPYVGLGVSPRLIIADDFNGVDLTPYGQIGVMFMRESSSRIYVDLRIAQSVLGVEQSSGCGYSDDYSDYNCKNETVHPTEFAFNVGIGW